jgi:hypothetical protein
LLQARAASLDLEHVDAAILEGQRAGRVDAPHGYFLVDE